MLTITLLTFAAVFIVLGIIVLVISYYDVIGVVHVIKLAWLYAHVRFVSCWIMEHHMLNEWSAIRDTTDRHSMGWYGWVHKPHMVLFLALAS